MDFVLRQSIVLCRQSVWMDCAHGPMNLPQKAISLLSTKCLHRPCRLPWCLDHLLDCESLGQNKGLCHPVPRLVGSPSGWYWFSRSNSEPQPLRVKIAVVQITTTYAIWLLHAVNMYSPSALILEAPSFTRVFTRPRPVLPDSPILDQSVVQINSRLKVLHLAPYVR